jgi:esterase/lipase
MDSREMYDSAWYLADRGFSTYRFSYYDGLDNARNITECTLETHAQDLDTVIEHFRKQGINQIFVIGHSFGGLAIILSKDQAFNGAVLWEPSHPESGIFKNLQYVKELDGYIINWGVEYVVGKKMVDHLQSLNISDAIENYEKPTLIVGAGSGSLRKTNRLYFEQLTSPKELIEIKKADHNFSIEGTFGELQNVTTKWLKAQITPN